MQVLEVLEDKINRLIQITVELKNKCALTESTNYKLSCENDELKKENAILAHDNAQLLAQIKVIEASMEQESKQNSQLNEEKSLAKLVVDDIIRSIDALVECENQP